VRCVTQQAFCDLSLWLLFVHSVVAAHYTGRHVQGQLGRGREADGWLADEGLQMNMQAEGEKDAEASSKIHACREQPVAEPTD